MDFLHHLVTEEEKKEIQKKAKEVLDDFSEKLSRVDKKIGDSVIEREVCERREGEKCEDNFSRKTMFRNAPNKNNDFIIAEKKSWD